MSQSEEVLTISNCSEIDVVFSVMAEFFEGAGQSEGLEIWRIEDLKPVKLPITQHGKFHEGDSYLVMNVSTVDNCTRYYC